MNYNALSAYAAVGSAIAAIIASLVSVAIYRHGLKREVRIDTIQALSAIRMKYPNSLRLTDEEKRAYLNELGFFAVGVNNKAYDIKIVEKMSGRLLLKQYDSNLKKYIEERRQKMHSPTSYIEYEQMINQLRKRIKK